MLWIEQLEFNLAQQRMAVRGFPALLGLFDPLGQAQALDQALAVLATHQPCDGWVRAKASTAQFENGRWQPAQAIAQDALALWWLPPRRRYVELFVDRSSLDDRLPLQRWQVADRQVQRELSRLAQCHDELLRSEYACPAPISAARMRRTRQRLRQVRHTLTVWSKWRAAEQVKNVAQHWLMTSSTRLPPRFDAVWNELAAELHSLRCAHHKIEKRLQVLQQQCRPLEQRYRTLQRMLRLLDAGLAQALEPTPNGLQGLPPTPWLTTQQWRQQQHRLIQAQALAHGWVYRQALLQATQTELQYQRQALSEVEQRRDALANEWAGLQTALRSVCVEKGVDAAALAAQYDRERSLQRECVRCEQVYQQQQQALVRTLDTEAALERDVMAQHLHLETLSAEFDLDLTDIAAWQGQLKGLAQHFDAAHARWRRALRIRARMRLGRRARALGPSGPSWRQRREETLAALADLERQLWPLQAERQRLRWQYQWQDEQLNAWRQRMQQHLGPPAKNAALEAQEAALRRERRRLLEQCWRARRDRRQRRAALQQRALIETLQRELHALTRIQRHLHTHSLIQRARHRLEQRWWLSTQHWLQWLCDGRLSVLPPSATHPWQVHDEGRPGDAFDTWLAALALQLGLQGSALPANLLVLHVPPLASGIQRQHLAVVASRLCSCGVCVLVVSSSLETLASLTPVRRWLRRSDGRVVWRPTERDDPAIAGFC